MSGDYESGAGWHDIFRLCVTITITHILSCQEKNYLTALVHILRCSINQRPAGPGGEVVL